MGEDKVEFDGNRVVVLSHWKRERAALRWAGKRPQASPEAPGGAISGGCDENSQGIGAAITAGPDQIPRA